MDDKNILKINLDCDYKITCISECERRGSDNSLYENRVTYKIVIGNTDFILDNIPQINEMRLFDIKLKSKPTMSRMTCLTLGRTIFKIYDINERLIGGALDMSIYKDCIIIKSFLVCSEYFDMVMSVI